MSDGLIENTLKLYQFFIVTGFICLVVAIIGIFFNNKDVMEYSFTIAIGLLALGFACLSVIIAKDSVKIAKDSDKRMITLAQDTFLEIAGILEDRRLILKNKRIQIEYYMNKVDSYKEVFQFKIAKIDYINDLSFSIWKCYTDLQRTELFKNYMRKNEPLEKKQNKIIKYLKLYYEELIVGRDLIRLEISPEYKKHIKWMYTTVKEFEGFDSSEYKTDLHNLMQELQK